MSDAEKADFYELAYMVGWERAKHDGYKKGYFESTHYPVGSGEYDGYQAFVNAVREIAA